MSGKVKDDLLDALREFESIFEEITDEWADSCYDTNFTDYESLAPPVPFTVMQMPDLHTRIAEVCAAVLIYEQKAPSEEEIWDVLKEEGMRAQKFVAFMWYIMERALTQDATLDERRGGVLAGHTYIALCSLNGSQAYKVFNEFLYQKSLDLIRLIFNLLSLCGLTVMKQTGRSGKGKGSRKGKSAGIYEDSAKEDTVVDHLSLEEENEVKELFCDALESLFVVLNKVALSAYQNAAVATATLIRNLLKLDFSEPSTKVEICRRLSDFQLLPKYSDRAFALMHRLIASRHSGARLVFGYIVMPRLLFFTFENTPLPPNAHPTKAMSDFKDGMLRFLKVRIEQGIEDEMTSMLNMLKNMCVRCPDRMEYRTKVASCICEVLSLLPSKYHYDMAHFIRLFASYEAAFRIFAIEIIPMLLQKFDFSGPDPTTAVEELVVESDAEDDVEMKENEDEESSDRRNEQEMEQDTSNKENERERTTRNNVDRKKKKKNEKLVPAERVEPQVALLTLIVRSCEDKSPTVRSKAVVQLAALLSDRRFSDAISKISEENLELDKDQGVENEDFDAHSGKSSLLNVFVSKADDPRASIRKSTVIALQALYPLLDDNRDAECALYWLNRCCRDPSLMVRKQAAESMTELLLSHERDSDILDLPWLNSVLPLINDREQSVVQLTSKLIIEAIISPILNDGDSSAWRILNVIEREGNHRRFLLRALMHQRKEGTLSENIVSTLLKKAEDGRKTNSVWMLLKELCSVFKVDPTFAYRTWFGLRGDENGNIVSYVAVVIARSEKRLNETARERLKDDISDKLQHFRVPLRHIPSVYYAFAQLMDGIGEDAPGAKEFAEFNQKFLDIICERINNVIYIPLETFGRTEPLVARSSEEKKVDSLSRMIFSAGEILLYDPSLATKKVSTLMQFIMASDFISEQLTPSGFHVGSTIHSPAKTSVAGSRPVSAVPCSQGGLPTSQGTSTGFRGSHMGQTFQNCTVNIDVLTSEARAHSVVVLGKMCVHDEKLAKSCIPIFARQLLTNTDHIVRNNIVAIMRDLCIRYTLLVDRYSAIVASCLKDRSTMVRKQTLTLLTRLIKEQFVRWEGQIMYRFVSTLLDRNQGIREYAELCLMEVLLPQFPNMFLNHFIECLFYFNGVTHASWAAVRGALGEDQPEDINLLCTLSGAKFKESRMKLYKFMLRTFDDQAKFTVSSRIAQEVYSAVVEGILNLENKNVWALLEDSYDIMCCPEAKLSLAIGQRNANAQEDVDDEPPAAVIVEAKKLVSNAFRRGIIEAVLPNVIDLKYYLQERRLGDLERGILRVLRELCLAHKDQLDEFMASDRQLKAEIEFDLKKLAEKEEREQRLKAQAEKEKAAVEKAKRMSIRKDVSASKVASSVQEVSSLGLASEQIPPATSENQDLTCVPTTDQHTPPAASAAVQKSASPSSQEQSLAPTDQQRETKISESSEMCVTAAKADEARVIDVAAGKSNVSVEEALDQIEEKVEKELVITGKASERKRSSSCGPKLHRKRSKLVTIVEEEVAEVSAQLVAAGLHCSSKFVKKRGTAAPENHDGHRSAYEADEHVEPEAPRKRAGKALSPLKQVDLSLSSSPTTGARKSPRLESPSLSEEVMSARAISTPTHVIGEVTFQLPDISAIVRSPPRRGESPSHFPCKDD